MDELSGGSIGSRGRGVFGPVGRSASEVRLFAAPRSPSLSARPRNGLVLGSFRGEGGLTGRQLR
jgi:hypothetical protein